MPSGYFCDYFGDYFGVHTVSPTCLACSACLALAPLIIRQLVELGLLCLACSGRYL